MEKVTVEIYGKDIRVGDVYNDMEVAEIISRGNDKVYLRMRNDAYKTLLDNEKYLVKRSAE